MKDITIGNWEIIYNPKPIPDRRFDYDVVNDDYDIGCEDLQFNCGSVAEAMEGIRDREERIMSDEKGKKITEGKRKWHAMPLIMLEPLADVFQAGVSHYGKYNVLKPFDNPDEDFYDSTMRHLAACQINPLEIDPQDGCYHLAKVAFGALARLYHCSPQPVEPYPCDKGDTITIQNSPLYSSIVEKGQEEIISKAREAMERIVGKYTLASTIKT